MPIVTHMKRKNSFEKDPIDPDYGKTRGRTKDILAVKQQSPTLGKGEMVNVRLHQLLGVESVVEDYTP